MTKAQAYAEGQRDGLDNKPAQHLVGRELIEAYQFGRLVASGLLAAAMHLCNSTVYGK